MFTVENIGNVKNAVYSADGMTDKDAEKIEYSKTRGLFKDYNYSKYLHQGPPKNASMKVYSELTYLKNLPEDTAKVDGAVVQLEETPTTLLLPFV